MHTLPVLLTLLLTAGALSAQSSLRGAVLDELSGKPLPGARATLLNLGDSTLQYRITDDVGRFAFDGLPGGGYRLSLTMPGLAPYEQTLLLRDTFIDLGEIRLGDEPIVLGDVEITAQQLQATQLGDTTQFNAAAFKTNPDANAEDLIEKIPGVVNNNGKLEVQGEQLKNVLVDGKPFFGNDPAAALKNLPADVIDKIQVFDQKSDQAQFTGFDDGETSKTLNIITNPNARSGQFGKAFAGYGSDERYQSGFSFNWRKEDMRLTFLGQSNNINQQNFAAEDLVGALGGSSRGPRSAMPMRPGGAGGRNRANRNNSNASDFLVDASGGITQTHAFGLNYVDQWGKKTNASGSYFFNFGDNALDKDLLRTYVTPTFAGQQYSENSTSNSKNINHRFNLRLETKFDSANSILFTPRLTFQQNDGSSGLLGQTSGTEGDLSQTDNLISSNLFGFNYSSDLLYRHAFAQKGRTLSLNLNSGYNTKSGDGAQMAVNQTLDNDPPLTDSLDQVSNLDNNGYTLHPRIAYTEPLGDKNLMEFSAGNHFQKTQSDRQTLAFDPDTQGYTRLDTLQSNTFDNQYNRSYAGAGFRRQDARLNWNINANAQIARLNSDKIFPEAGAINRHFFNVLPYAGLRYQFSKTRNLRFNYRTATTAPTVEQLQNVFDVSNPLSVSVGNPDLDQQFQHFFFTRYANINLLESKVFFAMLSGGFTHNYIGNSTYLVQEDTIIGNDYLLTQGAQLSTPVNLDGYWNARAFTTWGFPIKGLKTNLNLHASIDFNRVPGIINGQRNNAFTGNYALGAAFVSNISESVDFTLSSRTIYSNTQNSLPGNADNEYWNQISRARINLLFWKKFVVQTDLNHQLYAGLGDEFDQQFVLWNAAIGYKFMKNNLADLRLSIFDILHQNNSISRNVTDTYFEDVRTDVLQQYIMLTFTYQFRNFGGSNSRF